MLKRKHVDQISSLDWDLHSLPFSQTGYIQPLTEQTNVSKFKVKSRWYWLLKGIERCLLINTRVQLFKELLP